MTRKSADTSGDEIGPVTDLSYTYTINWEIINANIDTTYQLDDPQEAVNSESFDISLSMQFLELASFNVSYTFSQDLGDQVNKNHLVSTGFTMDF